MLLHAQWMAKISTESFDKTSSDMGARAEIESDVRQLKHDEDGTLARLSRMIAVICLITLASLCWSSDFYISPTGSDTANGTSTSSPWQTLSKVSGAALMPGDRVFLQGGQTFVGPLTANWSGSAGSPIVVDSYGTGRATIQITSATQSAISIYNRRYLEFNNLILTGTQMATSTKGGFDAYADAAADQPSLVARNLTTSGFSTGIIIGAWNAGWGFTDVLVENCESHDNRKCGIFIYGQTLSSHERTTIRGCLVYNNRGDAAETVNSGNGILVNGVTSGLIERCIARDNGDLGFGSVAIWTYGVSGVTIQYCEAYRQRSSSTSDGGGFDFDGGTANSIMQYNYSHDCDGAGFLFAQYAGAQTAYGPLTGNIVRYNITKNDGRRRGYGGLMFWGANGTDVVGANEIYNNTVYMGGTATDGTPTCVNFLGGNFSGLRLRNNVFIAGTNGMTLVNAGGLSASAALLKGNLYFAASGVAFNATWGSSYGSLAAFRASGQELNGTTALGLSADPLLTSPSTAGTLGTTLADALNLPALFTSFTPFRPTSGSPVIDAALNLTSTSWGNLNVGANDFASATIPQGAGYDLGALETTMTTAAPVLSSPGTASGTVGTAFSYTITASNSPTSYGSIGLPAGLSVNTSTGVISGTPTALGTSSVTLSAINAGGTGTLTLTLTIAASTPSAPVISSVATVSGTIGSAFSYTITASNTPTTYGASGLPAGLSVNASTGVISGTPTASGTSSVTLSATNAGGAGTLTLTLTIAASTPSAPAFSSDPDGEQKNCGLGSSLAFLALGMLFWKRPR